MTIPNLPSTASLKPVPFQVSVPEDDLARFKKFLELTPHHTQTFENSQAGHHGKKEGDKYFGLTKEWLEQARTRWEGGFDWRAQEKHINSYPQYTAIIPSDSRLGLPSSFAHFPSPPLPDFKLHFLAHISPSPDAVPIVLLHGWPGSFLEFLKVFDLLKQSKSPEFTIIAPSNPGYAWSDRPPTDRDFSTPDVAYLIDQLMIGLGFGDGYYAQGGDIGSFIARYLGGWFPNCKGVHVNFLLILELMKPGAVLPQGWENDMADEDEIRMVKNIGQFRSVGSAYALEHATRPATIGMLLESSPIALLAWVGEKLLEWTDPTQPPIDLDHILTVITVWWFTNTFPTSIYTYRGRREVPRLDRGFGLSNFRYELMGAPKKWAEKEGKLNFFKYHQQGGHFAAMEQPEALVQDVKEYINISLAAAKSE